LLAGNRKAADTGDGPRLKKYLPDIFSWDPIKHGDEPEVLQYAYVYIYGI
jgi:hypothetical protein